jgi:hypothetical protein
MKISEILIAAKALIDTPDKWTVNALARDINDREVGAKSIAACKFCSAGAIDRILGSNWLFNVKVYRILGAQMHGYTANFNDTHNHAEVMLAWDKAIAQALKTESTI